MIRMIVDRLHVSTSDREVMKYLRSRLNRKARFSRDPEIREGRRDAYREAIKIHHENQRLYQSVMTGRF